MDGWMDGCNFQNVFFSSRLPANILGTFIFFIAFHAMYQTHLALPGLVACYFSGVK
jgi:hypothetical protein